MVNIESPNLRQKFPTLDGVELDTLITKFQNLCGPLPLYD